MPRTKTHPGSIRRHRRGWQVRLTVGGERHEFTVAGTRHDAENAARRRHAELTKALQRQRVGPPGELRFSELVDRFRESELPGLSKGGQVSYEDSFTVYGHFFDRFNDPAVHAIRRGHIKDFVAWRRHHRLKGERMMRGSVSPYTVSRDLRVLHRLFNYALDIEVIEANPCGRVKAPKPDERAPVILYRCGV